MSKRFIPLFASSLVVLLVCLVGWSLAQQALPAPKPPEPATARFAVSANGDSAVLLEVATGKTWVLRNSSHAIPVWMPVRRLDSEDEVRDWADQERKAEHERAAERERSERATRDSELKKLLTPEAFERLKKD